jgi:hypothetical protein
VQGSSVILLEPPADPVAYANDSARCAKDVAAYKAPFDFASLGFGTISGAAKNAAAAVVGGPLVVAVGAAGGASDAASQGLDILGQASARVYANCVRDLTNRDGSALIADPN